MKSKNEIPVKRGQISAELRWGHPLLGFARFLAGTGFWISHAVVILGIVALVLLTWFETEADKTLATMATLAFGVALLFAFSGWIARYGR